MVCIVLFFAGNDNYDELSSLSWKKLKTLLMKRKRIHNKINTLKYLIVSAMAKIICHNEIAVVRQRFRAFSTENTNRHFPTLKESGIIYEYERARKQAFSGRIMNLS